MPCELELFTREKGFRRRGAVFFLSVFLSFPLTFFLSLSLSLTLALFLGCTCIINSAINVLCDLLCGLLPYSFYSFSLSLSLSYNLGVTSHAVKKKGLSSNLSQLVFCCLFPLGSYSHRSQHSPFL